MQHPSPQLLAEITAKRLAIESADASADGPHWGAMHKLLLKAKVDGASLLPIIGRRPFAEVKNLVAKRRGEEVVAIVREPDPVIAESDPSSLQSALKRCRRRMKCSRLDAESKLGVGPMSGGANHRIESMIPPKEFPLAVWDALVLAGKRRRPPTTTRGDYVHGNASQAISFAIELASLILQQQPGDLSMGGWSVRTTTLSMDV